MKEDKSSLPWLLFSFATCSILNAYPKHLWSIGCQYDKNDITIYFLEIILRQDVVFYSTVCHILINILFVLTMK